MTCALKCGKRAMSQSSLPRFGTCPDCSERTGEGHPAVCTLGTAMYDRRSQLDFWRPNPLWDPDQFRGRTFVIVGDFTPQLIGAFDRLGPPRQIRYAEAGQPIAIWYACVGYGYRGFGPIEELLKDKKY